MDAKKLAALAAAVDQGSFTRAAEQLGYTQSGLTHMMNSLEREIGFSVLLRDRRGVRLTPAGCGSCPWCGSVSPPIRRWSGRSRW